MRECGQGRGDESCWWAESCWELCASGKSNGERANTEIGRKYLNEDYFTPNAVKFRADFLESTSIWFHTILFFNILKMQHYSPSTTKLANPNMKYSYKNLQILLIIYTKIYNFAIW